MTPMMRSTLDVALWFIERAESVDRGRRLMPAIFLAADAGPLEPTIYHIFQDGPPRIINTVPSPKVETFLGACAAERSVRQS